MCNIWKTPPGDLLSPSHYRKLPKSISTVNITGGEPFLREDLVKVVRNVHMAVPRARMVFSTNGALTDRIVGTLEEVRLFHDRLGVGVSIDGVGEVHDRIRGVPGIFKHAIRTVERLKDLGYDDLRIAMTLSKENEGEARRVYELSKTLDIELSMVVAHNSEVYFKTNRNEEQDAPPASLDDLRFIMHSQLCSRHVKDWYRAFHTMGMMDRNHREEFSSCCEAGKRYFFMAPNGDVYPCNVMNSRIGNLGEVASWDDLFPEGSEKRIQGLVRDCKKNCWMVCNTRSLVTAHPMKTTSWVIRKKIGRRAETGSS